MIRKQVNKLIVMIFALSAFGVLAQKPALHSEPIQKTSTTIKIPPQAEAAKKLEALIRCEPGTNLSSATIESYFLGLGLEQKPVNGIYHPPEGRKIALLGGDVIAASIDEGAGKLTLYLNNQTSKQLAKLFALEKSPAPDASASYMKQTSEKTVILVMSLSGTDMEGKLLESGVAIICQQFT